MTPQTHARQRGADRATLAQSRLLEAKRLIENVMAELDFEIYKCPCSDHTRHYRNWDAAQVYIRLEAVTAKLVREAEAVRIPGVLRPSLAAE